MKSGVVENWELMEKFWHRSIFDYLRAEPDETVFLLTEPPMVFLFLRINIESSRK